MTTTLHAFIAANRFGLGPRPGELARISSDPRGWLKAQIQPEKDVPAAFRGQPTSADSVMAIYAARRADGRKGFREAIKRLARERVPAEMQARVTVMAQSKTPFRERLVKFWSNHFTVSGTVAQVLPLAGAFEREAIRPHVLGRFDELLIAIVRHPAMLIYLDNAMSIGPNSRLGRRLGRGLNENLAREIMELYTLGVQGGYTQADVMALANMLTGWSHGALGRRGNHDGKFRFRRATHEPGTKRFLGQSYSESGVKEAEQALAALVRHPSTAQFVATKLARHFIADAPPRAAVERLARVFADTGGDLAAVSTTLVDLDEAWANPVAKVKTPYEFLVSTLRALALDTVKPRLILRSLRELGQLAYRVPSPAGWPDRAQDWIAPEALLRRVEWSRGVAARVSRTVEPLELVNATIAPVVSAETLKIISRAPSVEEGIALVLASSEFQRR